MKTSRFQRTALSVLKPGALALILAATTPSLFAASYTWDADTGTGGIQDGNGTWSTSSTNWWNGTTNNAAVAGDALQIGLNATTTTGTITLNNGGSILNYVTASGTSAVTIYSNYVFTPNAAGDGLAIGNLTVKAGKTATFDAPIGTFNTGLANQDRTWTIENGAVVNVAAGGRIGIVSLQNTAGAIGTLNITGGTVNTGPGSAGATDFSSAANGANNGVTAANATSKMVVNYTGGNINGYHLLGGVGGGTSGTVQFNMNSGAGTYTISGGNFAIGEGGAAKSGGDVSMTINSGILTSTTKDIHIGGRPSIGANGNGVLTLNSGTISLGSAGYINIASGTLSNSTVVSNALNINGGLVKTGTTAGIRIGSSVAATTTGAGSTTTINIAGGETYIGTAGIAAYNSTAGITVGINLSGGTVGALGNWSSSYPMVLGLAGGGVTFKAANDVGAAYNITLNGALSGTGGFTKTGAGTLTLAAVNNYSGATTINSGTLAISGAGTLGSGDLTMAGGTLNLASTSQTVGAVTISEGSTISAGTLNGSSYSVGGNNASSISAALTGTGALTKNGAGTLTLSATNSYSGGTVLNSGILALAASGTHMTGQTLTMAGGNLQLGGNVVAAPVMNVAQNSTVSTAPGIEATLTGTMSGADKTVTFDIPRRMYFTANQGAFTGTWSFVNSGTFQIQTTNYQDDKGDGIHFDLGQNGAMQVGFAVNTRTLKLGALSGGSGARLGGNNSAGVGYSIGQLGEDTTFAGTISDGLTSQTGTTTINVVGGSLTLTGTNTYKGTTTVNGGKLIVHGSLSATSQVLVGGTTNLTTESVLGGAGSIAGNVIVGGTAGNAGAKLAPHQGSLSTTAGVTLTTANLTINSGAKLALQIGRTAAGSAGAGDVSDRVNVSGVTLDGADLELNLLTGTGYSLAEGDILFLIINNGGAVNGTFGSVNGVALSGNTFSYGGLDYQISYGADFATDSFTGGNDIALLVIPEPATSAMVLGGLGMLVFFQRMGRRHA